MINMPKNKDYKTVMQVDTKVYPLDAIYATSCVFIDKAYIFLNNYKEKQLKIEFRPKEGTSEQVLEEIKREFGNELLNYLHRIGVAKNNKKVREQIVQRALYSSIGDSLLGDDEKSEDKNRKDDPLGIRNPWNE